MTTIASPIHLRTEQLVFTYEAGAWPGGVFTGYRDDTGGFRLEHLVTFAGTSILDFVRAGGRAVWEQGFAYAVFRIPHAHPHARGLKALARRVGAIEYAIHETQSFFVVYRP